MEKIILEVKSTDDAKIILDMARRLDVKVIREEYNTDKRAEILRKIAKNGKIDKLISDPVRWQKEQRADREMPPAK